ncbi:MAG TPA: hypothetical protein VF188_06230 [Longimicrobiales bacterium]
MNLGSRAFALLALGLIAGSCNRLPEALRRRADVLPMRMDSLAADVAGMRERYRSLTQSDEFAFFAPYAEREQWAASFDAADRLVAEARAAFESRVAPLLEENRAEQADQVTRAVTAIEEMLRDARNTAREPAQRRAFLIRARDEGAALVATAGDQAERIDSLVAILAPVADRMRERYPRRAADIDSLVGIVTAADAEADRALAAARTQLEAHQAGASADYAVLGDGTVTVAATLERLDSAVPALIAKLGELDRSYTKILADMRADYWVQVGRAAWDNCCDGSRYEQTGTYPVRMVPPETYDYLVQAASSLRNGVIARYDAGTGWGGPHLDLAIPAEHWERLGVDPAASWPRGFDQAELWIEDAYPRTYHRYLLVENGDTTTTDWIEVDVEDFVENQADLGMAIVSKPYGYFEDEAIEEAAPPGMAFVGNPRYGEWRKERDGRSFWHWYGQYVFLSRLFGGAGYRYAYDDWVGWSRDYRGRRPYYGPDADRPIYGTWGSRTTSAGGRFARTTFARRGGFRSQDISLRGAGPAARGRGPAGGGK